MLQSHEFQTVYQQAYQSALDDALTVLADVNARPDGWAALDEATKRIRNRRNAVEVPDAPPRFVGDIEADDREDYDHA